MKTAFAIGAHPDDIEFMMAGTLILLGDAGWKIHYMNVANGSCGSVVRSRAETVRIRQREAQTAAESIGAVFHPSLTNDIEIFHEKETLAELGAVIRKVAADVLLVPSPEDYMEDHRNTSRLAVSAAFCRGMRNFPTRPRTRPVETDCTLYHAMPYGLRDQLRQRVWPGQYVDITSVLDRKREMLACHRSQKEWLDRSQGVDSYLRAMEDASREVGRMSGLVGSTTLSGRRGRFGYAEGWRRHSHPGFSPEDRDPLGESLADKVLADEGYERRLEEKPW